MLFWGRLKLLSISILCLSFSLATGCGGGGGSGSGTTPTPPPAPSPSLNTPTDSNSAANSVDENSSTGTEVGITASATLTNSSQSVTYSLTDDAGGLFAIDSSSGVVTVAGDLDFESASSHSITVQASGAGLTSSQSFTISVNDLLEPALSEPSDNNSAANSVEENSAIGTEVGLTATAILTDSSETISYSLTDDANGLFAIDSVTGVVTVAGSLDFESASNHGITVQASAAGLTSIQSFTISVTDRPETPPVISLLFPPVAGNYDGDTIDVAGTYTDAENDQPIIEISVNGQAPITAQVDINNGSWRASNVALQGERFEISITSRDGADNSAGNTLSSTLDKTSPLQRPISTALDSANNRLFVSDLDLDVLFVVDLDTGLCELVSGFLFGDDRDKGAGEPFNSLVSIAYDALNNRVLGLDGGFSGAFSGLVLSIDVESGDRTVLSSDTVGSGDAITQGANIAFDSTTNTLLVLDQGGPFGASSRIFSVDTINGNRTIVSDAMAASVFEGFAVDFTGNRAFTVNRTNQVIESIDLSTGSRTNVSGNGLGLGVAFGSPEYLAFNQNNGQVLVGDAGLDAIFSVDPSTGDRTIVSDGTTGSGFPLSVIDSIEHDSSDNVLIVSDRSLRGILEIDLVVGDRSLIKSLIRGDGSSIIGSGDLALDSSVDRLLHSDPEALYAINTLSGNRELIGSTRFPDPTSIGGALLDGVVSGFAFDSASRTTFAVLPNPEIVLSVDVDSGTLDLISGQGTGTGSVFTFPRDIGLDTANNRALVTNTGTIPAEAALLAVDLSNGDRSIISDAASGGVPLQSPTALALDLVNNRAFVSDSATQSVMSINLTSGESTTISGPGVGSGSGLIFVAQMAFDSDGSRLLVIDEGQAALIAVDVATGDRTEISGQAVGEGVDFGQPGGIVLGASGTYAFVSDGSLDAILAVDLVSGDRVVISRVAP